MKSDAAPETIFRGDCVHIICAPSVDQCWDMLGARWRRLTIGGKLAEAQPCPVRRDCKHFQFVPPTKEGEHA